MDEGTICNSGVGNSGEHAANHFPPRKSWFGSARKAAKPRRSLTAVLRAFAILIALTLLLVPKAGATTFTWDGGTAGNGTGWLTNTNWSSDTIPGTTDLADFGSAGTATIIGINLGGTTNNGTNNQAVGAIELLSTRSRTIGNSANNVVGTLTLNGTTVNAVANVILRNASTFALTLQDDGGGNPNSRMAVALGNATNNIINIDSSGGITISSVIKNGAANANLTLNGISSGILLFSGTEANTYSGTTSVNVGELDLSKSATVNAVAGKLTIGDGVGAVNTATVKLINADQIANTSDVTINSDGVLNLNNKTETIDALNSSSSTASVVIGTTTGTLAVGANNEASASFAGVISGPGGNLAKSGTGTQIFTGNNTYTGGTNVNAGTLQVSTGGSITGATAVNSGGRLSGGGTLGAVTVNGGSTANSGGILSPGVGGPGHPSATSLTVNAGTVVNTSGGVYAVDIAGASGVSNAGITYDQTDLTGSGTALTLSSTGSILKLSITAGFASKATSANPYLSTGGTSTNTGFDNYFVLNLTNSAATHTGQFAFVQDSAGNQVMIDYTTNRFSSNNPNGIGTFTIGSQEYAISYVGDFISNSTFGGNDVVVTAIPEPQTWAMMIGGLGTLILLQRRKRKID